MNKENKNQVINNAMSEEEIKELEQERIDGLKEMEEHNKKHNEYIQELEQERIDGLEEMEEYNKNLNQKEKVKETEITKDITAVTKPEAKVKPPMNTLNTVEQKADITKRKNAVKYLASAKENITKTLDISGRQKLKWSKEEIELMRRVRAISNELGAIVVKLAIIPQQQEEYEEIKQQLAEQPIADVKVECLESGEFSIVTVDTGTTLTTGSKEKIKGFLNGRYTAQQATTSKM